MNKPIRMLAIGCVVLFGLLLANVTYIQAFQATEWNADPLNVRARDAECARKRGPILVDGRPIAKSVPSHDELKYQRTYVHPKLYAPVTGYFSCWYQADLNSGETYGIENSYNSYLSGSDDSFFINRVVDLLGNSRPEGGSVSLTLDAKAQRAAYDGLRALGDGVQGSVVALDPKTGAILASVSLPTYDPNALATHSSSDFAQIRERLLSRNDGLRLTNQGLQQTYPPGSTFKVVVSSAAVDDGYTPESMVKGGYVLDIPDGSDLHNENGSSCGGDPISLQTALDVSCNVSFADLGLKLKGDALRDKAEEFGFDDTYLDDLPMAASAFPSASDLQGSQAFLALSSIGQWEVRATPLQMAMVASGVANDGEVMKPYIVDEVRTPDLDVIQKSDPEPLHHALTASQAQDVQQMMVSVVEQGTATSAQIPGVDVGAKTGTANSSATRAPYAWFISFAPADDPQVAVAVMVAKSDVARDDISGGGLAGPIAKDVMEAVLQ